jgi:hypothetical protein
MMVIDIYGGGLFAGCLVDSRVIKPHRIASSERQYGVLIWLIIPAIYAQK